MRKTFVALLLLVGMAALSANAFAQLISDQSGEKIPAKVGVMHSRAANLGVSAVINDTVWVGYSTALSPAQLANNYWSVGAVGGTVGTLNGPVQPGTPAGKPRPGPNSGSQTGYNGVWTWETPVHGDSLQGWWPVRNYQLRAGGDPVLYTEDFNRPWWAAQFGNIANYVINERRDGSGTSPGDRTFGVVGVWHSDPGNTISSSTPGTNPVTPAWAPIDGSKSAWMGQRGHGDLTVKDPITNNYFNADITDFLGPDQSNGSFPNESSKHFPGYGTAQDQMLYRDIAVNNNASTGVTVTFRFRSRMSFGKGAATTTRTGWFEGDPLQATVGSTATAAGNFISAEAGTPANSQAPVDSFQVYVGEPIGDGSSADGASANWTDSNNNAHTTVYDYARRWFNEVLKRGNRQWLAGFAGNHAVVNPDTTISVSITGAQKVALQGSTGRVRLVFRVHTNMGFDDENTLFSVSSSYNSGYMGAVQLDDVTVNTGTGATTIGDFEGSTASSDIDNHGNVTAANAWKSTGKAPAIYFHVHDLGDLSARWFDLCGGPNASTNICNMYGQVISMGNHDAAENNSGPTGTTEQNHYHGMFSPTINLVGNGTGNTTPNAWNLTTDMAEGTEDWYNMYEIYTGIFNLPATGELWQFGFEWYPVRQSDGSKCWSGLRRPPFRYFQPDPVCTNNYDGAKVNSALTTSNVSGIPDSARIFQQKLTECFRFGISDALCGGGIGLGLFDNLALAIVDGVPQAISNDIWQWFVDTFPVNETSSLVGTADFDTCTALVRASLNIAPATGDANRYDVAADSVVVNANGSGNSIRLDMIFRIKPGPGNYVTVGTPASGLRRVPTSSTPYSANDGSFWSIYQANPGDKSKGVHPAAPGWNILTWNSARCDTMQAYNVFACLGDGIDKTQGGASKTWASTYHEAEIASRANLATYVANNKIKRCFVKDTTVTTLNQSNVVCGTTPDWIRLKPTSVTGFTGDSLTTEGVQILPDGMFTPGTHTEYFFRREDLSGPTIGKVDFSPDTNSVYPQVQESSFDGHRWQEFSVLPDKWKDPAYGGAQKACMLYVDWNDRRGDEIIWTSVADSIGATSVGQRGQNNGWAAPAGAGIYGEVNNPAYFVNKNSSAGTTWDKYDVKCAESTNNGHNSLGARLSNKSHGGGDLIAGKDEVNAPTPDMLKGYYKVLLLLSGDLNTAILGPYTDRSANDVGILSDFLLSSTKVARKGLLAGGNGFVEDAWASGPPQEDFTNNFLGVDLSFAAGNVGYSQYSGNLAFTAEIIPQSADLGVAPVTYGIRNACFYTLDLLDVINGTTTPNATEGARYTNYGVLGPYISAVENKGDDAHPWYTLSEGWDIFGLTSKFDINTTGRLQYYYTAFANVFGSICAVQGTPIILLDTPNTGSGQQYVDFVGNFSNNPLRSGSAVVRFGLAHSDRVEVDIYDVAGRLQRKLADRMFPAGEHTLTWDGVNDQGHLVPRGVYFTQVKYVNRHIVNSKKLTVLK